MTRREAMMTAGAAAMTTAVAPASLAQPNRTLPDPALEFVFQFDVALGPPQELGVIDNVRKRIIPIIGGRIHGPRLNGEIMPGSADWQDVRPEDGLTRVFAHYWLKAADGSVISVQNAGLRRAPPETMKRMMAGEIVPPADYYFRASPSFDTGASAHRWLNENLFVCVGARLPDKAVIRTYLVR